MENRELEDLQIVWLRSDLEHKKRYGQNFWDECMKRDTIIQVSGSDNELTLFRDRDGSPFLYSYDMIDWDRTEKLWRSIDGENLIMPKIFDDWIKKLDGHNYFDSVHTLCDEYYSSKLSVELHKFVRDNKEKCVRAMLDGYEVEEEDLYIVKIPSCFFIEGKNDFVTTNKILWYCRESGEFTTQDEQFEKQSDGGIKWIKHLTEDDIKNCDERYIAFAEKV